MDQVTNPLRGYAKTHYRVECFAADGTLKWTEEFDNLVTTVGFNKALDSTFKTGVTSPTWYVGLVDNASFSAYNAADTMASHAGHRYTERGVAG